MLVVVVCGKFQFCAENFSFRVSNWGLIVIGFGVLYWLIMKGHCGLIRCVVYLMIRMCNCSSIQKVSLEV